MLLRFAVENFKCIKDRLVFDMIADKEIDAHKESLINGVIPVAAIYGPNGSGKSTVLHAFNVLRCLVLNESRVVAGELEPLNPIEFITPFKFDSICSSKPTKFDIMMSARGGVYKYYLSTLIIWKNGKVERQEIVESLAEMVGEEERVIFHRDGGNLNIQDSQLSEDNKKIIEKMVKNKLFPLLYILGEFYGIEHCSNVVNWFKKSEFVDTSVLIGNRRFESILRRRLGDGRQMNELKREILPFLHAMGSEIRDYKLAGYSIMTIHEVNGKKHQLRLSDESNGTQKLFFLSQSILKSLTQGSPLVVDEMDAEWHPTLLRAIIELYTNKLYNRRGAQLIFAAHDFTNMNLEVFRIDEIYLMALNGEKSSKLWSIVDCMGSKKYHGKESDEQGASTILLTDYQNGDFGANPYCKKMIELLSEYLGNK